MSFFSQPEETSRKGSKGTDMTQSCHFCVVVNQWCRGTTASGRPDDCLDCGRCERQGD